MSLATSRATIESRIRTTNTGGFTNWDRSLRAVSDNVAQYGYDLVLLITDGAPNYISNASGNGGVAVDGSNVTQRSLEAAIYSANAIKARGTQSSPSVWARAGEATFDYVVTAVPATGLATGHGAPGARRVGAAGRGARERRVGV